MNRKIKILVDDKEIDYYEFADEIRNGDYFFKENGEWYLHKRPTIEEDKKIEKLEGYISCGWNGTCKDLKRDELFEDLKKIGNKINEIIDHINKENKND